MHELAEPHTRRGSCHVTNVEPTYASSFSTTVP
jgi:hypothetical protein